MQKKGFFRGSRILRTIHHVKPRSLCCDVFVAFFGCSVEWRLFCLFLFKKTVSSSCVFQRDGGAESWTGGYAVIVSKAMTVTVSRGHENCLVCGVLLT